MGSVPESTVVLPLSMNLLSEKLESIIGMPECGVITIVVAPAV